MAVKRTQCPQCASMGRDNSGNNLITYDDGHSICFSCDYRVGTRATTERYTGPIQRPVLYACDSWPNRPWLRSEALEIMEVGIKPADVNGRSVLSSTLAFLYYNTNQQLCFVKYRNLGREAVINDKSIWTEPSTDLQLWGWRNFNSELDTLIICVGESDHLAILSWLIERNENEPEAPIHANILSLPGDNAVDLLDKSAVAIRKHQHIYAVYDNDASGRQLAENMYKKLPARTRYCVPDHHKDVSDFRADGGDLRVLFRRSIVSSVDILKGDALVDRVKAYLSNASGFAPIPTRWPTLNKMLNGGPAPTSVIALTANPGMGKTTMALTYGMDAALAGYPVFYVGTEMSPEINTAILCQQYLGKSIRDISSDDITGDFAEKLLESEMFMYYDGGARSYDDIESAAIAAIYGQGVRLVVIDVLSKIPGMRDYQKGYDILNRLNQLAQGDAAERRPPVAVLLVAHTVRDQSGQYPRNIELSNIECGTLLPRECTNILAFEGEISLPGRMVRQLKYSRVARDTNTDDMVCHLTYDTKHANYVELAQRFKI